MLGFVEELTSSPGSSLSTKPVYTARLLIYGIINNMGFLIHGFSLVFFIGPGSTLKLYFSVPVVL